MTRLIGNPSSVGVALPGQIPGTTTNDNAAAGDVGEYVETIVPGGSSVSLTSATQTNIGTLSLTPGDWEINGVIFFTGTGSTLVTEQAVGISTTSAVLPGGGTTARSTATFSGVALFATDDNSLSVGSTRLSLSTTTTVYLVVYEVFTISTSRAYGQIRARRVR